MNKGSIVPADCTILSLGMDHCETDGDTHGGVDGDGDGVIDVTDLVLNARNVAGKVRSHEVEDAVKRCGAGLFS